MRTHQEFDQYRIRICECWDKYLNNFSTFFSSLSCLQTSVNSIKTEMSYIILDTFDDNFILLVRRIWTNAPVFLYLPPQTLAIKCGPSIKNSEATRRSKGIHKYDSLLFYLIHFLSIHKSNYMDQRINYSRFHLKHKSSCLIVDTA